MDRVLFLESGRITLDGAPEELERNNQHYRTLLELEQGF